MAIMMDKKNEEYKGECLVFECIKKNLPEDIICYYNREINGKQFDFCLLIEHMGFLIIEVKGWNVKNIVKVESPDKIYTTFYDEPVGSPKKQARSYKFELVNLFNNKYNINPLVMDMVCYPFISEYEYKQSGLNIVSESEFTLFKEDIEDPTRFARKIAGVYQKSNQLVYDKTVGEVYGICRRHFETEFTISESNLRYDPYSELRVYPNNITISEIDEIIKLYFSGIKQIIFVDDIISLEKITQNICGKLDTSGILLCGKNFLLNSQNKNTIRSKDGKVSFFNFEAYYIEGLSSITNNTICVKNGQLDDELRKVVKSISGVSDFNYQQYMVEHAEIDRDIVVKAGAGTGKTFSMISRIAFICHQSSGSNISDVKSDIAMLTFTTKAATNMKTRLKQVFMNYFVLTRNKKYLEMIAGIENMCISTIHSFANSVIKNTALPLGIGVDFATISGNYQKQRIFDAYFNDYLLEKNKDEPLFFGVIPCSIYEFRKMLLKFSDMLYNKGFDIKEASDDVFGKPIEQMPYLKEIIEKVIIKTEKTYSEYLYENNEVNLSEYMIYLNKCVKDESFNTNLYKYKYIFIDEFQDVDDSQISAFLEMQKKLKFNFFIVGDLKQSIYRFRGATMDAFNKMGCSDKKWVEYTLNINYRTDKRLLDKYAVLFEYLGKKNFIPYHDAKDSLEGIKVNDSIPDDKLIESCSYTNEDKKNDEIYKQMFDVIRTRKEELEDILKVKKLSSAEETIAILVRTNYQIATILRKAKDFDDILVESDSNGDLYKLQSSIDLCKLTAALCNPRNPVYLFDLLLSNNVNIDYPVESLLSMADDKKTEFIIECLDQFYNKVLNLNWNQLVYEVQSKPVLMVLRKIYDATKPWKTYSADEAKQVHYRTNYDLVFEELSVNNKYNYLTLYSINESLHILINMGSEKTSRSITESTDYVKVICTTVHKSKGLEYDMVIMPMTDDKIDEMHKNGLDVTYMDGKVGYCINVDGISISNEYFYTEDEIRENEMEECRILYVALTRAINKFYWFNKTDSNGETWGKLLEEI